jgi:hypothetical protein
MCSFCFNFPSFDFLLLLERSVSPVAVEFTSELAVPDATVGFSPPSARSDANLSPSFLSASSSLFVAGAVVPSVAAMVVSSEGAFGSGFNSWPAAAVVALRGSESSVGEGASG